MNNKIIVLTGKQGSGKDTVMDIFYKLGYSKVKLYTTRQQRDNKDNNYGE